jgi:peptidyl-prolyl cis-trans isomerase SurA
VENKISIELIWNDLILSKYKDKISIDTINLRKQLENETNEQEKLYLLSELIFNVENKSSLEKKINMIKKDIEEQGFSNAVLIHSISTNSINDGGKIGWVNENSLNFKMKSTLSKMLKGDYSEPIIVPGGFLILKIDDIKNIKNDKIDIDKKLNEIIISKTREQLDRYSNIYYNKVEKNFTINEI